MNFIFLKEKLPDEMIAQSLAKLFSVDESSVKELLEEGKNMVRFDWHYLKRESNQCEASDATVFAWQLGIYPHVESLSKHFSNNLELAVTFSEIIRLPLIVYAESPHPCYYLLINKGEIFFVNALSDGYASIIVESDAIPLVASKIQEAWIVASKHRLINRPFLFDDENWWRGLI